MEPGATSLALGSVRFCVPWRPDGEHRDALWTFCRAYWERVCPDIELVTADVAGIFNRSAAINRAAEGSWDVAVALDADVVADADQVYRAVEMAQHTGRLTLGFEHYAGLTPHMTKLVMEGYEGERDRGVRYRSDRHESSIVAVPRALWDDVGGFIEAFQGWGQDDVAFAHACRILGGGIERVPGNVWHLWHPRSAERDKKLQTYRDAQALGERFRSVTTEHEMRALLAESRRPATIIERPDEAAILRSQAFSRIYRANAWNGRETRSGPGSGTEATAALAEWLPAICDQYGIGSVLDAGCGEGTWQPELPGYVGVDIVREALAVARRKHPERTYGLVDICRDILPEAEAVLCRDALQHLSLADGQAAISNFRRMGAKYLIASSHQGETNRDITSGGWYPSNLEAAPFWMGEPLEVLFDGHWEGVDRYPQKVMGLWTL